MSADDAYRVTRAFVDGLAESGVKVVAVGAGSRSTGAVLAFHDDGRFRVFSFVDERSAAFFALGAARVMGRPAAVVTTSGTAAANVLPAAVEARVAGVPLLLLTADRPPELHDVGAMQTVEQVGLLPASLWSADLHTYDGAMLPAAGHLAAQACAFAEGSPPGPVHVNVRFREPLISSPDIRMQTMNFPPVVRRDAPILVPDEGAVSRIAGRMRAEPRGLIYIGHLDGIHPSLGDAVMRLSGASQYPVIAEATSRLRGRLGGAHLVDAGEALIRAERFAEFHRPGFVLRLGGAPLTRRVAAWLDQPTAGQIVVSPSLPWPDPARVADEVLAADPSAACAALAVAQDDAGTDASWAEEWTSAGRRARAALDERIDLGDDFFEGTVARALAAALPEDALVYAATSLSIRALNSFTPADVPLEAFASRGASGIDGTLSLALGAAAAAGRPTACLTGDLAFLHDLGGLAAATRHRIPLVTVVVDNGGGGIFEFLPHRAGIDRETFEDLFATAHTFDLAHAAELFGIPFVSVDDVGGLQRALAQAFAEGSAWVIRAEVDPRASVEAHRATWAAAAAAL